MPRSPRHSPDPWRRSIDESLPSNRKAVRHVASLEILVIVVVVLAVLAMAIWFLFVATGGPGPGTV